MVSHYLLALTQKAPAAGKQQGRIAADFAPKQCSAPLVFLCESTLEETRSVAVALRPCALLTDEHKKWSKPTHWPGFRATLRAKSSFHTLDHVHW